MAKRKRYLPSHESDRVTWLNNFALKLNTYAALLGITPADLTLIANAAVFYAYVIGRIEAAKGEVTSLVAFKNKLSFSTDNVPLGPVPQPELPTEPTAVPPGIFTTVARIVADIKNNPNYSPGIGDDLKIIGEETLTQDPALLKPILKVKLSTGGHPQLSWKKKGADFTNVYVDRGTGFTFLRSVKGNSVIDNHALPAGGTTTPPPTTPPPAAGDSGTRISTANAAVWRYRIVYVKNDAETGEYSDPVSVAVGQL
jgi:hypothetical protein